VPSFMNLGFWLLRDEKYCAIMPTDAQQFHRAGCKGARRRELFPTEYKQIFPRQPGAKTAGGGRRSAFASLLGRTVGTVRTNREFGFLGVGDGVVPPAYPAGLRSREGFFLQGIRRFRFRDDISGMGRPRQSVWLPTAEPRQMALLALREKNIRFFWRIRKGRLVEDAVGSVMAEQI